MKYLYLIGTLLAVLLGTFFALHEASKFRDELRIKAVMTEYDSLLVEVRRMRREVRCLEQEFRRLVGEPADWAWCRE